MALFSPKRSERKATQQLPDVYRLLTRKETKLLSEPLPPPREHVKRPQEMWRGLDGSMRRVELGPYLEKDRAPIPPAAEREDYFPGDHAGYWFMGLRDYLKVQQARERFDSTERPLALLDLGCSSGRVLRHFAAYGSDQDTLWGTDIAMHNIEWVRRHLGNRLRVFQNSVYPHLPLPDGSLNVATAFSVFTHIDTFEDAWLLELRRLLQPGGIAYVTVHTERVWSRVAENESALAAMERCRKHTPEWDIGPELFRAAMPAERIVFRWSPNAGYRCNTFTTQEYIQRVWGQFFEVCEIFDGGVENYQDIVILRRRAD